MERKAIEERIAWLRAARAKAGTAAHVVMGKLIAESLAELDALPKRWPCKNWSGDSVLIGVIAGDLCIRVVDATVNPERDITVSLTKPHAIEAGRELIRLGGGEVMDKAAVLKRLCEADIHYGDENPAVYSSKMINELIADLGAGNVR